MKKKKKDSLTLKEFIKTLKWIFSIYLQISPAKTILFFATRIVMDLRGLIYASLFAKIIDELVDITSLPEKNLESLIPWLVILFLYYVFVAGLINNIYQYNYRALRQISRNELNILFAKQLNYLGIQNLENPTVLNRVNRAEMWLFDTFSALQETIAAASNLVRVFVSGAVIVSFFPLMIPALLILTLVKFFPDRYFMKKDWDWSVDNSEESRKAGNSIFYLKNANSLQEISIVGGFNSLKERYTTFYEWFNAGVLNIMKKREITNFFLFALDSLVGVVGYAVIFLNFIMGKFTLGTASFQMKALDTFSSAMDNMLGSITYMNEFAIKIKDLVVLFEMEPKVKDGTYKLPYLDTPPVIEFKNVSFKYPKAKKFVFKNLSFRIRSGEEVALVGHNGAGKTTIVKLLARIYSVTSGEILINGVNINTLSLNDWYKNLGVLFQDFNFYGPLSVKENISFGKPTQEIDENRVIESAKNADAHEFILDYKNKYDTIMSEKYKGGIRPSFGQMQKIAIARFFYRNAPLAIFDEPTAAIDAVSEYKIFNKIYGFFENKTVIIISHRFSTVRQADRIFVLEKGEIVEEGSHQELLKKKGTYEKAYKLQAEGYKD